MKTHNSAQMPSFDVHEALAHAHAERGEFFAQVFGGLAALSKRIVVAVRHHRHRKGAIA